MNKFILVLLFVSGLVNAETAIDPKEDGPFEKGRLVYQTTSSRPVDYVITDLKTGCQYMQRSGPTPSVLLGCSPEYISPKFKK